jgi:hypothetical protein
MMPQLQSGRNVFMLGERVADNVPKAAAKDVAASLASLMAMRRLIEGAPSGSTAHKLSNKESLYSAVIATLVRIFGILYQARLFVPWADRYRICLCDLRTGAMVELRLAAGAPLPAAIRALMVGFPPTMLENTRKLLESDLFPRGLVGGQEFLASEQRPWNLDLLPPILPGREVAVVAFEKCDWEWAEAHLGWHGSTNVPARLASRMRKFGMCSRYDVVQPTRRASMRMWFATADGVLQCKTCRTPGRKSSTAPDGDVPQLRWCAGCKQVLYCSERCQASDWHDHKPTCKLMRSSSVVVGDRDAVFAALPQGIRDRPARYELRFNAPLPQIMRGILYIVSWKLEEVDELTFRVSPQHESKGRVDLQLMRRLLGALATQTGEMRSSEVQAFESSIESVREI